MKWIISNWIILMTIFMNEHLVVVKHIYIYAHKYELHKKIALHCFLFTQEINNSENLIFTLLILN